MLFRYLLPGLLAAATAVAAPLVDAEEGEVILFKRDDVLGPRDLELADTHGVNLTEMYRHSILKRDDGDHVTIWVDRDFVEYGDEAEADAPLAKRQGTRLPNNSGFRGDWISDYCHDHRRQDHTGPNGPFSGGVQALYRWTRGHSGGSWSVSGNWRNLIIAGSNSGANALYRARVPSGARTDVGTQDVRNDADWTQKRARSFNGRYRASSRGGQTCSHNRARMNYELIRTSMNV